jgi:hypothetical protein
MALETQVWLREIAENLFADNTFVVQSIDHSGFVNNRTVHVPQAGAPPAVSKTKPFAPGAQWTQPDQRTDTDLTYDIEPYYVGPTVIDQLEKVELSYDKRQSILLNINKALQEEVHKDLIYKWLPTGLTSLATGGDVQAAPHIPTATGKRISLTKKDILKLDTQFNKWDFPQDGRNILLDAEMYDQLLESLTETAHNAFLGTANVATGMVGRLYSFNIYMRSTVAKATGAGAVKKWDATAAATDSAAALVWSRYAVSRAKSDVKMYDNEGSAMAFGDVLSAEIRAGGSHMRADKKGIMLLYQGTPAA